MKDETSVPRSFVLSVPLVNFVMKRGSQFQEMLQVLKLLSNVVIEIQRLCSYYFLLFKNNRFLYSSIGCQNKIYFQS